MGLSTNLWIGLQLSNCVCQYSLLQQPIKCAVSFKTLLYIQFCLVHQGVLLRLSYYGSLDIKWGVLFLNKYKCFQLKQILKDLNGIGPNAKTFIVNFLIICLKMGWKSIFKLLSWINFECLSCKECKEHIYYTNPLTVPCKLQVNVNNIIYNTNPLLNVVEKSNNYTMWCGQSYRCQLSFHTHLYSCSPEIVGPSGVCALPLGVAGGTYCPILWHFSSSLSFKF